MKSIQKHFFKRNKKTKREKKSLEIRFCFFYNSIIKTKKKKVLQEDEEEDKLMEIAMKSLRGLHTVTSVI